MVNHQPTSSSDQNRSQSAIVNSELKNDIIDLTLDQSDLELNVEPSVRDELIEEKRNREQAERPFRLSMRDYRISMWFKDYELYKNDLLDETERIDELLNVSI